MTQTDTISKFDGGLTLVAYKHLSTGSAISSMEQSKQFIIPLQQHIGIISQPLVKKGERVLKGQMNVILWAMIITRRLLPSCVKLFVTQASSDSVVRPSRPRSNRLK
jgi:hypothetical protein